MDPKTSAVLTIIGTVLQLINAVEPDIAAIIAALRNGSLTLEQYLADADKTLSADLQKAKDEQQ